VDLNCRGAAALVWRFGRRMRDRGRGGRYVPGFWNRSAALLVRRVLPARLAVALMARTGQALWERAKRNRPAGRYPR
jgi:hypothetical protein